MIMHSSQNMRKGLAADLCRRGSQGAARKGRHMNRRKLLVCGILAPVLIASSGSAQQVSKVPRIGVLLFGGPGPVLDAFRHGFEELGYVDRKNILIEPRFAQGQLDRMPELAAELVNLEVDVIAAVGAVAARAAQKATTKIPIVMVAVIDPVAVGMVATLQRPGGNVTGITNFDAQQPTSQFELLKEVFPKLARVAILSDEDIPHSPTDPGWNPLERANDTAARALGLSPQTLKVRGPTPDLDGVYATIERDRADALLVLNVPVTFVHRQRIAELASAHRVPTMFGGGYANAGGLITYGTSGEDMFPRMAGYVDKILKGANPGDLPIDVVIRRELIVNLRTAREIGVTIPPEVVRRADRVIE
jgi:putative ABC transport system substrate-binding protein